MLVSRTPLRVSFVGGGTDLPSFYEEHGGAVVSTAIDKWVRVVVSPRFEGNLRVAYSETEIVDSVDAVRHDLVRESMRRTGVPRGVDVLTLADVPSRGTGLGSSSAVTVGLLNALYAFQGISKPALELAKEACEIEIEVLGKPIGRQDQYATAVGGFNLIEFLPRGGGVRVSPVITTAETLQRLHRSLLMFHTGAARGSDEILRAQSTAIKDGSAVATMLEMRQMAYEMCELLSGEGDVEGVGHLLDRAWKAKRRAAVGSATASIDELYARAREAGALGGKVLGAGGGGFLLLAAPPSTQTSLRKALAGLREVPFRFASAGTQILMVER